MSRFTATPPNKSKGSKPLTIKEFSNIRVAVPTAISYAGLVLMGRVTNDGSLEIGYVRAQDVPAFKPVEDLQKLGAAARIVSGIEAAEASITKTAEIKTAIVTNLVNQNLTPNVRPQASAELYKCKALTDALESNLEAIQDKVDPMKTFFENMIGKAHAVINKYLIMNQITSTSDDKLYDICTKDGIPKYIFDKLTSKSIMSDIKQKPLIDLIFPNKIEKGIQLSKAEFESTEMKRVLVELEQDVFDVKGMKDMEKAYLIPTNFKDKIGNVLSLPTQRADSSKPVLNRIKYIQDLFYDIDPYDCTENRLNKHAICFKHTVAREEIDATTKKSTLKYVKQDVFQKPFVFDTANIAPIKQQYTEFLQRIPEDAVYETDDGAVRVKPQCFHTAKTPVVSFYHTKIKSDVTADALEKVSQKVKFEPKDPKLFNYQYNSPLSKEALIFVKGLAKGKVNPSLIKNIQGFLVSFHSDALQDLAVRRMLAAAQQKQIVIEEEEDLDDEIQAITV
jgi:hypothetical protein